MKNRFLVYNVEENDLLFGLISYIESQKAGDELYDEDMDELSYLIKELISFASEHGFYGNLWQVLITYFLLMDENPYTLSVERRTQETKGSVYRLALSDIDRLKVLFDFDICTFGDILGMDLSYVADYSRANSGVTFSALIRDMVVDISKKLSETKDSEGFMEVLNDFYKQYGVGDIGLHKAFRIEEDGSLYPINNISKVILSDLIGLETQKEELLKNTGAFLKSKPANNCLLYGDAGTGKSTSIKAIANEFFPEGLRIVEIYKHQLKSLNDVIAKIKGRNYKFILYMDDLSFEEFEIEYKYLKALIEGGLEKKPDNVLIYATSNRRHLVRESFGDRNDDIHRNDSMQEKLSLYGRFGVTIYYGAPDKKEYNSIVLGLRDRYGIKMSDEEILAKANAWEFSKGGRSGRSAEQFVDYLRGEN